MNVTRILPLLINCRHIVHLNSIKIKPTFSLNHFVYKRQLAMSCKARTSCTDDESDGNDSNRHLNYKQLLERKSKENVVLIDVREHSEVNETGKLPGSIHIPLGELKKALTEMTPEEFQNQYHSNQPTKTSELIFSCKSGNRSAKALKLSLELGFSKAAHYQGGYSDWVKNTQ